MSDIDMNRDRVNESADIEPEMRVVDGTGRIGGTSGPGRRPVALKGTSGKKTDAPAERLDLWEAAAGILRRHKWTVAGPCGGAAVTINLRSTDPSDTLVFAGAVAELADAVCALVAEVRESRRKKGDAT